MASTAGSGVRFRTPQNGVYEEGGLWLVTIGTDGSMPKLTTLDIPVLIVEPLFNAITRSDKTQLMRAARGVGKAAKGGKGGGKGDGKGCGRVAHQTHFAPPPSTPDIRLSRRSDGGRQYNEGYKVDLAEPHAGPGGCDEINELSPGCQAVRCCQVICRAVGQLCQALSSASVRPQLSGAVSAVGCCRVRV